MESPALFNTLLAATAAGSAVDGAVLTAARLANLHHARLCIVHAVPLLRVAGLGSRSAPVGPPSSRIDLDDTRKSARRLHVLYASHCPSLKPDDIGIVRGVAWEAVFRTSVQLACDLIVMGPHARPANAQKAPKASRFLGSTADGVISRSRCPVMIANGAFEADQLDFKRVVVGVDFSDSCTAAVGLAALFAKRSDAFVSIFHMLPIAPYPKSSPRNLQVNRERQQERMAALYSHLLEDTGYQFVLKAGVQPHTEILNFVEHVGADLIVMGSHTRDRTGKWYAGSVVQRVTRHVRRPVIVVNGPDALTPWEFISPPVSPPLPPATT